MTSCDRYVSFTVTVDNGAEDQVNDLIALIASGTGAAFGPTGGIKAHGDKHVRRGKQVEHG